MKRTLAFLLILVLCLSVVLTSCSDNEIVDDTPATTEEKPNASVPQVDGKEVIVTEYNKLVEAGNTEKNPGELERKIDDA